MEDRERKKVDCKGKSIKYFKKKLTLNYIS